MKETNLVKHVTKKAGWSFNLIYLDFLLVNPSQQELSPSQVCTRCDLGPLGMTAINPKIRSAEFDPEWYVCRACAQYILSFQTYCI